MVLCLNEALCYSQNAAQMLIGPAILQISDPPQGIVYN